MGVTDYNKDIQRLSLLYSFTVPAGIVSKIPSPSIYHPLKDNQEERIDGGQMNLDYL